MIFPQKSTLPFYFASVSSIWVYYLVPSDNVGSYLQDSGAEPALFDGQAMALLNFQRFTAHFAPAMSVTNEAQFNIMAYPTLRAAQVPEISVADFLAGGEQTKLIGAFRLWVPADNPNAVSGGKELFYEPTFLTTFTYQVPDLNDPSQTSWDVTCNDPTDAKQSIFTLKVDDPPASTASVMSPVTQYTLDPKRRLFSYGWNLNGTFQSSLLDDGGGASIAFGTSSHPMGADMRKVLAGAVPVGVQIFNSPPAAASTRGFVVQ